VHPLSAAHQSQDSAHTISWQMAVSVYPSGCGQHFVARPPPPERDECRDFSRSHSGWGSRLVLRFLLTVFVWRMPASQQGLEVLCCSSL